ncbi:MAG: electron transfer flavoprotein subunit alpha/FixB family protein [FCB group bacterium]|nr:electron transfer flavoprotein subunit alpha/FixB family protein [FCB group bacterium]
MKILSFIQQENGKSNRLSIEALTGAQKIAADTGETVTLVVFGEQPAELSGFAASEIIFAGNPELKSFSPLFYTSALEQIIQAESPDLVIFGHSYEVRDWVPRLSARLGMGFIADCTGYSTEPQFTPVKQIYQGKINADVNCSLPCLLSFQSGVFRTDEVKSGSAAARSAEVDLSSVPHTVRPGEKFQEAKGTVDLSRAEIIVSIGRGVGKEENMPIIQAFADALGAELGSSRPVVDYGWLPHERQVGSSGQTVSPKLYIAVGLSGAIQHQVGMKGSGNIIAINKDENAPIFEIADIGVVEDLFEIIPKLTEAIKAK